MTGKSCVFRWQPKTDTTWFIRCKALKEKQTNKIKEDKILSEVDQPKTGHECQKSCTNDRWGPHFLKGCLRLHQELGQLWLAWIKRGDMWGTHLELTLSDFLPVTNCEWVYRHLSLFLIKICVIPWQDPFHIHTSIRGCPCPKEMALVKYRYLNINISTINLPCKDLWSLFIFLELVMLCVACL